MGIKFYLIPLALNCKEIRMLTKELLEETHTAEDYPRHVSELIQIVKNSADGIKSLRLREGLSKTLIEESYPLACMATNYFLKSPEVSISLKVGNQNYDAIIEDRRGDIPKTYHVEITQAIDGEEDYLRSKVLHETGSVSALGPVRKTGTKKTGLKIEVDSVAVSQREVLYNESTRIARAISRKGGKNYPENTVLLIAFNDVMAHDRKDNVENIKNTVEAFSEEISNFTEIIVIGTTKNLCLVREIETKI